jgi:hypothetical protein
MRWRAVRTLLAGFSLLAGCGGGTGAGTGGSGSGAGAVNNVQPIQVSFGPANDYVNGLFTSVTICAPGTENCQTIDGVLVDSGSVGLRLLASRVTLPLPRMTDASGRALANCASYVDNSYTWGPLATADIRMAGEQAGSVPIQIIGDPAFADAPDDCSSGGTAADTVSALGANGILGLAVFREDCGPACTGGAVPPVYFTCPAAGPCAATAMSLPKQLQNPVWRFARDNNGVLVSLPAVPAAGAPTVAGSLIFGIGTQSNNSLGGARVFTTDDVGNFSTVFEGTTYSGSYLDTGSNGLYFQDADTIGLPACPDGDSDFSCPPTTLGLTATTIGHNGGSATVGFSVANAESLFNTNNAAFNDLAGPDTGDFDWGLPFFFGRPTFIAIEGQSTPGGTGPYWAY